MYKYKEIKEKPIQFLSLTSLKIDEFEELLIYFTELWEYEMKYFTFEGKVRQRAYKEKKNGIFPLAEDKLFFILYFLKNNPLQENLAASFKITQPQANIFIYKFLSVLEKTLSHLNHFPTRNNTDFKKLLERNTSEKEFYADGVERLIPRNTDREVQKEQYSGKRKAHTYKNLVVSNRACKILFLSETEEGKMHDKKIIDQSEIELPKGSSFFLDTGFVGYEPKGDEIQVIMPTKKSKGKELTKLQKEENKKISQVRVKVEHVMSGIKRLRIVKDKIRLRGYKTRDLIMKIASAIHNFRLEFRPWNYPETKKILQT